MEDLNVHETNPKVSKESSASVLGAMLPTVPPDKKILKKEGMIDMIPEELMEFIYNEDATYTYAVEGAIANIAHNVKDKLANTEHSQDVKTNSLPFKVRQLTIERATLKVKISWMAKRKSKQEKVNKYRARLAEVEKALRKIQNAVNNDADKKEMERQIKELDASVVKQTSKELEQRGVLESVNNFLRVGKEEGFILFTMGEFTMNELYPAEEEEPITEGANLNMASALADAKLKTRKALKKAKKAIKKGNFDEAADCIKNVKEYVKDVEEQVKDYPHDSLSTNLIGALTGWITYTLISTLKSLGIVVGANTGAIATGSAMVGSVAVASKKGASDDTLDALAAGVGITGAGLVVVATGVAGAAAFITNIIGVLRRFKANIDESRKKKKDIDVTFVNGLYNRCLVYLKDTYKALDKLESGLRKAKSEVEKAKKAAEKEVKESTAFTILDAIVEDYGESVDLLAFDDMDMPVLEGVNTDLMDVMVKTKLRSRSLSKKAKKAIKDKRFKDASNYIKDLKKEFQTLEKAVESYPTDSLTSNLFGMILGGFIYTIASTLMIFSVAVPTSITAAAAATESFSHLAESATGKLLQGVVMGSLGINVVNVAIAGLARVVVDIRGLKANLEHRDGDKGDTSLINRLYNRSLTMVKDALKHIDKLEQALAQAKMAEKLKDTKLEDKTGLRSHLKKESVEAMEDIVDLVEAYESGLLDEPSFLTLMVEAKKPDDGMMGILSTLNGKGYKTKYSCSGHKDSGKSDRNDDGIVNGKLTSAARIMFQDDYDFPDPPKHWGFKTVEGKDYLYVLPYSNDGKDPKAFDAWKNKYMASLDRWAKSLPNVKTAEKVITKPEEEKTPKESDVTESVDYNAAIDNELAMLLMDTVDLF